MTHDREGQALALRYGGVPGGSNDREGQALALRPRGVIYEDRAGTKNRPPYRRAGACPPPCPGESKNREEQKPPTYRHYTVGRGPVPRHASDNRTLFTTHDREGQALALRAAGAIRLKQRSRGTGPRPTGRGGDSIETTIARDRPSRYGPRGRFD